MSKYTKELLLEVVTDSQSVAQVLSKLGLTYSGGNYSYIKKLIIKNDIDISHFTGQAHNKGKTANNRTSPDEYLISNSTLKSHSIKLYMLRDGIREHQCESCKNKEWMGNPIPLELHHIDGDRTNNLLENLQLLCPNCHALTDNHAGKANRKSV